MVHETYQDIITNNDPESITAKEFLARYSPLHKEVEPPDLQSSEKYNPDVNYDYEDEPENMHTNADLYIAAIKAGAYGAVTMMIDTATYRMPGNGVYRDSCQMRMPRGCVHPHERPDGSKYNIVSVGRFTCGKLSCPKCVEHCIHQTASRITERVCAGVSLYKALDNKKMLPKHIVVSVPREMYEEFRTKKGHKRIMSQAVNIAKRCGVEGAAVITHMWRFRDKEKKYPFFSPHLHFVASGWIDYAVVKSEFERTGFITRKLSVLRKPADVYGCTNYLLTHTGIRERKTCVRYVGAWGNNKFRTKTVPSFEYSASYTKERIANKIFGVIGEESAARYKQYKIVKHQEDTELREMEIVQAGYINRNEFIKIYKHCSELSMYENPDEDPQTRSQAQLAFAVNTAEYGQTTTDIEAYPAKPKDKILTMYYLVVSDPDPNQTHPPGLSITKSRGRPKRFVVTFNPHSSALCKSCTRRLALLVPESDVEPCVRRCEAIIATMPEDMQLPCDTDVWKAADYGGGDYKGLCYLNETDTISYDINIPRTVEYVKYTDDEYTQIGYDTMCSETAQKIRADGDHKWSEVKDIYTDMWITEQLSAAGRGRANYKLSDF